MTKKRKSVVIITALALVALLLVGLTVAYLTDSRTTLNVLGIGRGPGPGPGPGPGDDLTAKITLTEPKFAAMSTEKTDMVPGSAGEYSRVAVYDIKPGQAVMKDPTITNVGLDPVYVRVKLTFGADVVTPATLTTGSMKWLSMAVDLTKWTYSAADSYWYYTGNGGDECAKLPARSGDASKVELFQVNEKGTADEWTLKIPEKATNSDLEDMIKEFQKLEINAQAIQGEEFTPGKVNATKSPWVYSDGSVIPDADVQAAYRE